MKVQVGDVVRIGKGKLNWTVKQVSEGGHLVLHSSNGARRWYSIHSGRVFIVYRKDANEQ